MALSTKMVFLSAVSLAVLSGACRADNPANNHSGALSVAAAGDNTPRYNMDEKLTDAELKARKQKLTRDQYRVTQEEGTEPPFHNPYWDNHAAGIYVDVVSGEPLFSSKEKFESGTGWPSFWKPLEPANVVTKGDNSLFMARTEVRSRAANSHLGHLFDDGPKPTGLRYCMNSASMRFVPAERLSAEGYGKYAGLFPEVKQVGVVKDVKAAAVTAGMGSSGEVALSSEAQKAAEINRAGVAPGLEVAVLSGGCFWGMQELLRKLDGVVKTEVGYAGGASGTAQYEIVSTGETGHAESVKVVFDPKKVSYEAVLKYFFKIHDPTTINRQEHDTGSQYRSVIWAQSAEQERIARQVKALGDKSGKFSAPIVTQIVPAMPFYRAEDYHQDYLQKHPSGYQCHYVRNIQL